MEEDSWEVQHDLVVPVIVPGQWDDEDQDDDVKEDWDAESDQDSTPVQVAPKPKKKLTIEERILERKMVRQSTSSTLSSSADPEEDPNETAAERKVRLARQIVESDFQNMRDLFDGVNVHPREGSAESAATGGASASSLISTLGGVAGADIVLKSKDDLESISATLSQILTKFTSSHHYYGLIDNLLRAGVASLNLEETRKISATLSAIINDKTKALKESTGGGGKKKSGKKGGKGPTATLGGAGAKALAGDDLTNYDEVYDDFDGFM